MRRIIVAAFVSLDGVMQAPGGPEEDPTGGFAHGGWVAPHWDDALSAFMDRSCAQPFDLLLGRRTYDIFAAHWPHVKVDPTASDFDALNAGIAVTFNRITKHVATHRPQSLSWINSVGLGTDAVSTLRALKRQDGPPLMTQGSTELLALLFEHDLVDELRLIVFPVVLGTGKRLFASGAAPGGWHLASSEVSASGVIMASYERAGSVHTGSFALENPTQAEIERRSDIGA